MKEQIKKNEIAMWEAAKNKDAKAFQELVCEDAVMVCGGYRCLGAEYAQIIGEFDCASYEFKVYETVLDTDEVIQNHYVIGTKVGDPKNKDLEGDFHITSTWRNFDGKWKLVYNMDSRIFG